MTLCFILSAFEIEASSMEWKISISGTVSASSYTEIDVLIRQHEHPSPVDPDAQDMSDSEQY